jgi:hypothetical protein
VLRRGGAASADNDRDRSAGRPKGAPVSAKRRGYQRGAESVRPWTGVGQNAITA